MNRKEIPQIQKPEKLMKYLLDNQCEELITSQQSRQIRTKAETVLKTIPPKKVIQFKNDCNLQILSRPANYELRKQYPSKRFNRVGQKRT